MKHTIIIITLIILFSSCEQKTAQVELTNEKSNVDPQHDIVELTPEQAENSQILTATPQQKEIHSTLKVNGVIDLPPQNIVSISVTLGGYLKKTSLIPGARVRRGTLLATLQDPQYIQLQQDFLMAKSRLEYAQADFIRQRKLKETESTSEKILQQAKTEFEGQQILVKSLSEKLLLLGISPAKLTTASISRTINIYSPIDGYVTKVNGNIGRYVNASDILFELINPRDVHVRLTIFEDDASKLAVGQEIVCFTNDRPDDRHTATIALITPNIEGDRSTDVHAHLHGYNKRLLPGMFINGLVKLNNKKVTAVPEEAIVKWNNRSYLFTQEAKHKFKLVAVETGASSEGFVEIRTTLPGTNIVTKNAYTLLMKMKNSSEDG